MSTITISGLSKRFGDTQVVKEFSEVFADGEFVTLLGPSGCGKTTMLRMIAGFEVPTSGEIRIDGRLVSGGKTFVPPEGRNIGMVFQSYAVWPHMNVFDNVAYPLTIKHAPRDDVRRRVEKILETVHLTRYRDRMPNQLSGGQQQRIALARALVAEPKLLLLDEPLSNLDAKLRESMRFEIKDIAKSLGISVVYVTHDQTEAMAMSDRIFLLNSGIVQQSGAPDEIYNHPVNPFVADFLGKVGFFPGTAEGGRIEPEGWGCSLPYPEMMHRGPVIVAIRPENIRIAEGEDGIPAVIERLTYLGDETDCRVRIGSAPVRAVEDGYLFRALSVGSRVFLRVREFIVFPGDSSSLKQLEIQT